MRVCALESNISYKIVNRKGLMEKRSVMHSDGTRGMDEGEKINKSEREKLEPCALLQLTHTH